MQHWRKKNLSVLILILSCAHIFPSWYSQIRSCDWHCQNKMHLAKSLSNFIQTSTGFSLKEKLKLKTNSTLSCGSCQFINKKPYKITTQHPENNNTLSQRQKKKIQVSLLWDSNLFLFFITLKPSNYDNFAFNSFGPTALLHYRSPLLG